MKSCPTSVMLNTSRPWMMLLLMLTAHASPVRQQQIMATPFGSATPTIRSCTESWRGSILLQAFITDTDSAMVL